ncbi:MAG: hypothetical protein HKM91_05210 [Altererythrobacter sp.]|nr:hypothetical protein [Altererythrobacter sp.]
MALFSTPSEPPPESEGALAYVLWVAREWMGASNAEPSSAVMQDLGIFGDDVDDFALKLAERHGDWVANWPWDEFADLNEGTDVRGCLMLPILPLLLAYRFIRGLPLLQPKQKLRRLELAHIAKVLEAGEWSNP